MKKLLLFLTATFLFFTVFTDCDTGGPKQVELKIFIAQPRFREQYTKYFDQFAAKYKQEKGVEVTYTLEMPADDASGSQLLRTRFASSEGVDVFSCHAINELPEYTKAGYTEDLSSQSFVAKLLDNVKPVVAIDGKVRAVPLESLFWGICYNEKIFNELNIKPALTITELKEIISKVKAAGYTPFLLAYKDAWIPQLLNSLIVGGLVNSEYPDFIDHMNKGTGSFADLKDFFTIIDLVDANGNKRPLDIDANGGNVEFASGKYAMYVQGPWMAQGFLEQDPNFKFGVAPLPLNDNPKSALINIAVSTCLCVNPKSPNKEVALALINYILDDKDSNAFYESLKFNPVAKIHTFATYPWVESAMVYVKQGKGYIDPKLPQAEKDEVGPAIQSYYLRDMSKADVIKALDNAWKSSLK
jgi:raffinose/stachyose/melibiose transport system substrate-binding protein